MAELPFLKKKMKMAGGGAMETTREPDMSSDDAMLDDVAGELFEALERKDKRAFRQSLEALVLHIKDADEMGDE